MTVPDEVFIELAKKKAETVEGTRLLVSTLRTYLRDIQRTGIAIDPVVLPRMGVVLDACLAHLPKPVQQEPDNDAS